MDVAAGSCRSLRWTQPALQGVRRNANGGLQLSSGSSRVLPLACVLRSPTTRMWSLDAHGQEATALKCRRNARFVEKRSMASAWTSSRFFSSEGKIFLTVRQGQRYYGCDGRRCTVRCRAAGAAVQDGGWDFTVPLTKDASILQKVRALCFYATTFVIAAPLFIVMLILHPFVLLLDKRRRKAQHLVNKVWAKITTFPFYKTEILGRENLPSDDEGAVYVANHQSFLDIYTLFQLGRPFKFISKTSNFLIPIIGWAMYLTGHVPLKREDKKSQLQCLRKCVELLGKGVSVLFFPEGTRTSDGSMAAFKKGAFSVAAKAKARVVPISLIGTGKLMPNKMEHTLRPGLVKVIIHPPIAGVDPDELCQQARSAIAESLTNHGLPVH